KNAIVKNDMVIAAKMGRRMQRGKPGLISRLASAARSFSRRNMDPWRCCPTATEPMLSCDGICENRSPDRHVNGSKVKRFGNAHRESDGSHSLTLALVDGKCSPFLVQG